MTNWADASGVPAPFFICTWAEVVITKKQTNAAEKTSVVNVFKRFHAIRILIAYTKKSKPACVE